MRRRALFESWRGRYSDSPRYISEEMARVDPSIRRLWIAGPTTDLPPDVQPVRRHRPGHFAHLAAADLLVTNDIVTRHFVKGPRVTYLQAWHGSPIKKIGLDETAHQYEGADRHLRRMLRDVAKWDYLLSSSPEYTRIFRSAFGYEGEVLEIGYPRNDALVNDDGSRRAAVRSQLGLDPEQTAVLYAPTWRDNANLPGGGFFQPAHVDWGVLTLLLPENVVVLNRLHEHVRSSTTEARSPRVVDVSDYGDVTDLILASDALVSDYSSIICDYAVTGKPMVFHAPDLDEYRDRVRGFYFDYESWAPGPITATTEQLAGELTRLDAVGREYADRLGAFRGRFCTFETGRAAELAVRRLLEHAAP